MLLCEQFGWTFEQLDDQDETRLYVGLQLANLQRALQRCQAAIEAKQHPAPGDLELWGWAMGHTANA